MCDRPVVHGKRLLDIMAGRKTSIAAVTQYEGMNWSFERRHIKEVLQPFKLISCERNSLNIAFISEESTLASWLKI